MLFVLLTDINVIMGKRPSSMVMSSQQQTTTIPHHEWMEALPFPIFGLSSTLDFQFANYAAEVFFEQSRHLLLKTNLHYFFEEDSPIFGLIRRLSSELQSVGEQEMSLLSPRLGKKLVTIQVAKMLEYDGYIISLQMREMADQLRGQLQSRGAAMSMSKMTSLLAHEIKNPLAGIKGAAQLIQLDGNDEQVELSELIVEEVNRIADLLGRIENMTGAGKLRFVPLNVHEVLNHVINVTAASFERTVTIERNFDPSLPDITADRALLIQAFLNLLKNACEACSGQGRKGVVKVITSYALSHVSTQSVKSREKFLPLQIDIIDNGIGIPDALRDILFEPFISDKPEGSGLGLAVVASAVAEHGGVVSVKSEEEQAQNSYTHFQILLPLSQNSNSRQAEVI